MIIGYTSGAFDLFHIGHLNLLRNAKSLCDRLIVGVSTDELVRRYKHKDSVVPFEERIEIVRACRYVDIAVPQYDLDKRQYCQKMKIDFVFVGDDWYQTESWKKYESELAKEGIVVVYFPYTQYISSSTRVNDIIKNNLVQE